MFVVSVFGEAVRFLVCVSGSDGENPGLKPIEYRSAFLRWTEVHLSLLKQGAPTGRRILQTYPAAMMTGLGAFLRNAWRRAATGESRSVETWRNSVASGAWAGQGGGHRL
jgi:hypothetical protein